MTGKELKRMGRKELVELIFQMKQRELELENQLEKAQAQLEDRRVFIANSGSIAEAALGVGGVFEAAQAAADCYLESLKAVNGDVEAILEQAREQAREIVAGAELEAVAKIQKADQAIHEKWQAFREKCREAESETE